MMEFWDKFELGGVGVYCPTREDERDFRNELQAHDFTIPTYWASDRCAPSDKMCYVCDHERFACYEDEDLCREIRNQVVYWGQDENGKLSPTKMGPMFDPDEIDYIQDMMLDAEDELMGNDVDFRLHVTTYNVIGYQYIGGKCYQYTFRNRVGLPFHKNVWKFILMYAMTTEMKLPSDLTFCGFDSVRVVNDVDVTEVI